MRQNFYVKTFLEHLHQKKVALRFTYTMFLFTGCCSIVNASKDVQYIKSINYPVAYLQHQECQWTLNASVGYLIVLIFEQFNLENNTLNYVELSERVWDETVVIAKLYLTQGLNKRFVSSGSKMFLKLRSEGFGAHKGFKASFKQGVLGQH